MELTFKSTPLFGGAITAELPATFIDASDVRQIPDNQEVYLDRDGFTSIVIEILEQVQAASDEAAFQAHLVDLTGGDEGVEVSQNGIRPFDLAGTNLPTDVRLLTLEAIAPPGKNEQQRLRELARAGQHVDSGVRIFLALLRLPSKETDILISVNVPEKGESQIVAATQTQQKLLQTFKIESWDLFC